MAKTPKSKLTQVLEAKNSETLLKIIAESSKILSSRVVNEEKDEEDDDKESKDDKGKGKKGKCLGGQCGMFGKKCTECAK